MTSLYKKSTIKTKHESPGKFSSQKMATEAEVQLNSESNSNDEDSDRGDEDSDRGDEDSDRGDEDSDRGDEDSDRGDEDSDRGDEDSDRGDEDSELEIESSVPLQRQKHSEVTKDEEKDSLSERGEDEREESDCSDDEEESDDAEEEEDDDEEEEDDDDEEEESDSGSLKDADEDGAHSESEDRDDKVETENDIKKELSTMSFEDIMKLQNKVGTKVYNEVAYGTTMGKPAIQKGKRLNKNRPVEISAKRPAPYLRQVIPVKKAISRDPRFDDLSGEYKPEIFEKTYKFINDIRLREKQVVQKTLKKVKSAHKKEKLEFLLERMENQERARKSRELQREKELEFKRKQRELAGQGLQPYFLKKSDKKKLDLADKYNELKRSGKLENFLSKKRKRNAGKDRKKLPFQLKDQ